MYENWGCEFLDLEDYKPYQHPQKVSYDRETLFLSVEFAERIANPIRLREISVTDAEYIRDLQTSVLRKGVEVPVLVNMAINACALIDGHHRLLAAKYAGLDTIPARLSVTNDNLAVGVKNSELFEEILWQRSDELRLQTEES